MFTPFRPMTAWARVTHAVRRQECRLDRWGIAPAPPARTGVARGDNGMDRRCRQRVDIARDLGCGSNLAEERERFMCHARPSDRRAWRWRSADPAEWASGRVRAPALATCQLDSNWKVVSIGEGWDQKAVGNLGVRRLLGIEVRRRSHARCTVVTWPAPVPERWRSKHAATDASLATDLPIDRPMARIERQRHRHPVCLARECSSAGFANRGAPSSQRGSSRWIAGGSPQRQLRESTPRSSPGQAPRASAARRGRSARTCPRTCRTLGGRRSRDDRCYSTLFAPPGEEDGRGSRGGRDPAGSGTTRAAARTRWPAFPA